MANRGEKPVEQLLNTPNLADALESDRFKQFLDHVPFAIVVSELQPTERIIYANLEFERLTGQPSKVVQGKPWDTITKSAIGVDGGRDLSEAIAEDEDYIGVFTIEHGNTELSVDAWSNVIQGDDGIPMFRLAALAEIGTRGRAKLSDLERRILEKDTLLRELQHRVKNNLQMITSLIRLETRNLQDGATGDRFDRLAGRVNSLALLYKAMSADNAGESVDLGVYLSEIASAVMQAHAVEGIRLNLKVDTWPVSINVAMPTGLVVNELLTNSLKHAFIGREGGTISLHSLVDQKGCRVIVADDGVGLVEGAGWPKPGKLGALIVRALEQNAHARVDVESEPNKGVRTTILFSRADAAPTRQ
jgi:two-component sensor histidine kinase